MGAVAFSAGGFAALLPNLGTFVKRSRPVAAADRRIVQVALDIGLVLAVGALPIYFRYMKQMAAFARAKGSDWQQMRRGIIAVMNLPGGAGFRIEPLLLPIFVTLALLAFYEYDGGRVRRLRTYLFLVVAAGFALSSSGRSEVLLLMVGLVAIAWTKWDPPQLKLISTAAFAFVLLFGANQVLLEKTNASSRASLAENLPAVANGFASYAMGGIVGFDYVLRHPGATENGWRPTRIVTSALNKFGGEYREHVAGFGVCGNWIGGRDQCLHCVFCVCGLRRSGGGTFCDVFGRGVDHGVSVCVARQSAGSAFFRNEFVWMRDEYFCGGVVFEAGVLFEGGGNCVCAV